MVAYDLAITGLTEAGTLRPFASLFAREILRTTRRGTLDGLWDSPDGDPIDVAADVSTDNDDVLDALHPHGWVAEWVRIEVDR